MKSRTFARPLHVVMVAHVSPCQAEHLNASARLALKDRHVPKTLTNARKILAKMVAHVQTPMDLTSKYQILIISSKFRPYMKKNFLFSNKIFWIQFTLKTLNRINELVKSVSWPFILSCMLFRGIFMKIS